MVVAGSIDDLFRQKPLQEIHGVLRQMRADVEAKKQELRELVGDHYRSVLESSDHIRAMSECASKISAGVDRIDGLIESIRTLAANPPAGPEEGASVGAGLATAADADADRDYKVGLKVMALLEVPETVRAHLGAREFARAARLALADAAALRGEVEGLLRGGPGTLGQAPAELDLPALVAQQALALRALPRQIAAACLDAFAAARLEPHSAAQAFAVHLLLDSSARPAPLLRTFFERRAELLRGLLQLAPSGQGSSSGGQGCGARMAAAAMAYEGTLVLSCLFCEGGSGGRPSPLRHALDAVLEGSEGLKLEEERAAIEGRTMEGLADLRRRADATAAGLLTASAAAGLATELELLGARFVAEWASPEGLPARLRRLVAAAAAAGELRSCRTLGEVHRSCADKVRAYRNALIADSQEEWGTVWRASCRRLRGASASPAFTEPPDALAVIESTVEAACGELARERVGELRLDLELGGEVGADTVIGAGGDLPSSQAAASGLGARPGEDAERRHREELVELHREARLRVLRFDEQLGEVMEDLAAAAAAARPDAAASAHAAPGGAATTALVTAIERLIEAACEKVQPPDVPPEWPPAADRQKREASRLWPQRRAAARAAVALEALQAAATADGEGGPSHLQRLLSAAQASGDHSLGSRAGAMLDGLRRRSSAAYRAWARLLVLPEDGAFPLESFWRLADDEVPAACGWGSAVFQGRTGGAEEGKAAKAVPVPIQASPFALERLALASRRALAAAAPSPSAAVPLGLVAALKASLSESFMAAYTEVPREVDKVKRTGMNHLLQWLFDLHFLRLALSAPQGPGQEAYEALRDLLDASEARTLSDPVDRLLYQEVLKSSVRGHVAAVKILLAPLFTDNPLYGLRFQPAGALILGREASGSLSATNRGGAGDGEGFELQPSKHQPFRHVAPRFPLLPVAMGASPMGATTSETDPSARFGLSDASARAAAAAAGVPSGLGAGGTAGVAAVSSLMQQAVSGLSLGQRFPWGR